MKKGFIWLLTISTVFAIIFSFVGCGSACAHNWVLQDDTSTCEDGGVKTYTCSLCQKTKTENVLPAGHNWTLTSSTLTCGKKGKYEYTCKNCGQTKTETTAIIDHQYENGYCKYCGRFQYNITVDQKYNNTYYWKCYGNDYFSMCSISDVKFEVQNGYVVVFFYGTKYYDYKGDYGDTAVAFTYVLKDTSSGYGKVVTSDHAFITGLVVSQDFSDKGYVGYKLIQTSNLDENKSYTLEINDYE